MQNLWHQQMLLIISMIPSDVHYKEFLLFFKVVCVIFKYTERKVTHAKSRQILTQWNCQRTLVQPNLFSSYSNENFEYLALCYFAHSMWWAFNWNWNAKWFGNIKEATIWWKKSPISWKTWKGLTNLYLFLERR